MSETATIGFESDQSVPTQAGGTTDAFSLVTFALRPHPAPWATPCLQGLNKLRRLLPNWDSYGAKPIDERSVMNAATLVVYLSRIVGIEAPIVTASPNGNAALCWDDGTRSLDVEVHPNGSFEYSWLLEDESDEDEGITRDWEKIAHWLTRL